MGAITQLWWLDRTGALAERIRAHDPLDEEERSRRDRYRQAADRDRFTLGRGLARLALGPLVGAPQVPLRFELGAFGRPALAGRPAGPWFNIAHSGDMVVLVLSSASPWIGVDVEVENRAVAIDELAAMVCAPSERAWLDSIDPGDRRAAFFASWTLKEAYLKAIGLGLQRDPARQVFDLSAGTVARSLDLVAGAALADWRFGRWRLRPGDHLAVAVRAAALPTPVEATADCWRDQTACAAVVRR